MKCSLVCKNWKNQLDTEHIWINLLLKEGLYDKNKLEEMKKQMKCTFKDLAKLFLNYQKECFESSKTIKELEDKTYLFKVFFFFFTKNTQDF